MARKTKKDSKLKDGDFRYGNIEMTDEEYQEAQNPKVRTTIFLEEVLINAYKKKGTLSRGEIPAAHPRGFTKCTLKFNRY